MRKLLLIVAKEMVDDCYYYAMYYHSVRRACVALTHRTEIKRKIWGVRFRKKTKSFANTRKSKCGGGGGDKILYKTKTDLPKI